MHIQGVEVGHVMMLESEHPFREYDPDFFHRFCKLVSMELQKNSAYSRNKGVMYSYFPGRPAEESREMCLTSRNG